MAREHTAVGETRARPTRTTGRRTHRPQRDNLASKLFWDRWLQLAIVGVVVDSAALVVTGRTAGRLFDVLGFRMRDAGILPGSPAERHVLLVHGVLGSVMIGWMATLWLISAGPLQHRDPWAWTTVTRAVALWFVIDTSFSLAVGAPTHAWFNLAFLLVLAPPLIRMRPQLRTVDETATTAERGRGRQHFTP